jgi:hypothetical protein
MLVEQAFNQQAFSSIHHPIFLVHIYLSFLQIFKS